MKNIFIHLPTLAATAAALGACTSTEVRDLATATAANTALVSTKLDTFAANSRNVAEARTNAIAELAEATAAADAEFQSYREAARSAALMVGDGDEPSYANTVSEFLRLADALEAHRNAAEGVYAARRKEILNRQDKLQPPRKELSEIAKGLSELATEKKLREFISFLIDFYEDVEDGIEAAKNEAGEISDDAVAEAEDITATAKNIPLGSGS